MGEAIIGLIGALIGALAGIAGAYLTFWLNTRHEHERALRAAVADVTQSLAAASHEIVWLTWQAKEQPDRLTEQRLTTQVEDYNREMDRLFPEITGRLIVVASLDHTVYSQLSPLIKELEALDERIARATILSDTSVQEKAPALKGIYDAAYGFEKSLPEKVTGVIGVGTRGRSNVWRGGA
jgi:hypothetical protein